MIKTPVRIITAVNLADVIAFISANSNFNDFEISNEISNELNYLQTKQGNYSISLEHQDDIWQIHVKDLPHDSWIYKFTVTQELQEDYYILFTD